MQSMVASAAARPGGRISEVFTTAADRQAAYDFLENSRIKADSVREAAGIACARACSKNDEVLIALDGTSLTLTDNADAKGFGRVGTYTLGARGLKVITSLALSTDGTPLGVPALVFWARQLPEENRRRRRYQSPSERESRYWRDAVDEIGDRFHRYASRTRLHFIADREADASLFIRHVIDAGHRFTVRANGTRHVLVDGRRADIFDALYESSAKNVMHVEVTGAKGRTARTAKLTVRAAHVELTLRDYQSKRGGSRKVTAVWAYESETCPPGEQAVNWLLYTNAPVHTLRDAIDTVRRYAKRWRIEDFHRTWKRGRCRVEETQLRSFDAVVKWATILAVVAARAEHLRHVARTTPEVPATTELTQTELEALIILKRREKKKNEVIPDDVPTIAQAVRWLADLGGYVGHKSSGPPGATVIARGLERMLMAEEIVNELRSAGKLR